MISRFGKRGVVTYEYRCSCITSCQCKFRVKLVLEEDDDDSGEVVVYTWGEHVAHDGRRKRGLSVDAAEMALACMQVGRKPDVCNVILWCIVTYAKQQEYNSFSKSLSHHPGYLESAFSPGRHDFGVHCEPSP